MKHPFSLPFYGLSSKQCQPHAAKPYVTSPILHPYALATVRALMSLYCFTTIVFGYSWLAHHKSPQSFHDIDIPTYTFILDASFIGRSFSFFTFLTFWSLAFYFGVAAFHTFDYARRLGRRGDPSELWLQKSFECHWSLQLAYGLWHTTVTTYPFLVSIVFWAMLFGGPWYTDRFAQWLNISVHGLNSLFAVVEIGFSATRPPPFFGHLLVICLILGLYLGLAYLSKATADFYPYAWMDPQFGWVGIVGHVLGYGGGMVAIYSIVWGVKWIKVRVVEGPQSSKEKSIVNHRESTVWSGSESTFSAEDVSDEKKDWVMVVVVPSD